MGCKFSSVASRRTHENAFGFRKEQDLHQSLVSSPPTIGHIVGTNSFIVTVRTTNKVGAIFIWMRDFHPPTIAFSALIEHDFVSRRIQSVAIN